MRRIEVVICVCVFTVLVCVWFCKQEKRVSGIELCCLFGFWKVEGDMKLMRITSNKFVRLFCSIFNLKFVLLALFDW